MNMNHFSDYHLLLDERVSDKVKTKLSLKLGLFDMINPKYIKTLCDRLDYHILMHDHLGITNTFHDFKKKVFLSNHKKAIFLRKAYPFLPNEVEKYANEKKINYIRSYFDYRFVKYNHTLDSFLLRSNYQSSNPEKINILNDFFEKQKLSPIFSINEQQLNINALRGNPQKTKNYDKKVSVVLTTFNNEEDIESSILSILNQTYKNLELIIVNDASNDQTPQILERLKELDHRIKLVNLETNIGTYKAKNIALELVDGDYLAFHDGDDFAHPMRLEESIKKLESSEKLVAVSCRYARLNNYGLFTSIKKIPLISWSPLTLVMKVEQLKTFNIKFDEVRFGADSELFARLISSFGDESHQIINKVMLICNDRENSLMKTNNIFYGFSMDRKSYTHKYNKRILRKLEFK